MMRFTVLFAIGLVGLATGVILGAIIGGPFLGVVGWIITGNMFWQGDITVWIFAGVGGTVGFTLAIAVALEKI